MPGLLFAVLAAIILAGCGAQRELSLPDTSVKEENEWIAESFEGRVGEPLKPPPPKADGKPRTSLDLTAEPVPGMSSLPYLATSRGPKARKPASEPQEKGGWLKEKRVTILQTEPIPATEALKYLYSEGINIATAVPLENYLYAGFGIEDVPADAALRMILTSLGLDYSTDDEHRIVTVLPMPSKTWYLTLGNRVATYKSESSHSSNSSNSSGFSGSSNSTGSSGFSGSSRSPSAAGGVRNSGERTVEVTEDLWTRLKEELEVRMKIMLMDPGETEDDNPENEGLESDWERESAALADIRYNQGEFSFAEKVVGRFSLNPETGAVFVQAPQWIIDGLDRYIARIRSQYDTVIGFQGQVLQVSTTQEKSEGLDLSAFGSFLGNSEAKFVWSNNALGGITVTEPTDTAGGSLSIGNPDQIIGNTHIGLMNRSNSLRVFNNYLSSFGAVTVAQRPMISTTSGIPAEVSSFRVEYYNTVSQTTVIGETGNTASVGTTNTLVPAEFGTLLRILPHYDPDKDLVRARVVLKQKIFVGVQEQTQYLSDGQEATTQTPIVTNLDISGELLLRDGDLVVVGGQTEHVETDSDAGIMGTRGNRWLSPITRTKRRSGEVSTYFFALRINVLRR